MHTSRVLLGAVVAILISSCGSDGNGSGDSTVTSDLATTTTPAASTAAPTETTEAATEETTEATTEVTTEATATTDGVVLAQPAIWPTADTVFATPEDAAADFVRNVLDVEPLLGDFQSGDSRSGEIEVFSPGEAAPVSRGVLSLRILGPNDGWFVLGAANPNATIDAPATYAEVPAGPLDVEGVARGFEGTVTVTAFVAGDADVVFDQVLTSGGAAATPEPYAVTVDVGDAVPGDVVGLLVRGDAGLENDPGDFGAVVVVIADAPTDGQTAPAATGGKPTSAFAVVPAPSLADNLLGDPAELDVAVWLPPTYETSTLRYPVVYFLAGFGESASTATIGAVLERLIDQGRSPEMILVGIDGINSLGGSFYVDSSVTGNWAQAIHRDLVAHVDANYRTLPRAAARGVAGFSMGGFGALDLAMRHPDVFGSVYALSPGLLAPGGLETTQMFADDDVVADFLALQASDADELTRGSTDLHFSVAYGAAFSPDPGAEFPHVAYPITEIGSTPDPEIWAEWEAGYGGVADEVEEFADNLRSLRGIALDYGTDDQYEWIPDGVAHLADQLEAHAIPARVSAYDGGHGPVGPRVEAVMFPFFAEVLDIGS